MLPVDGEAGQLQEVRSTKRSLVIASIASSQEIEDFPLS